MIDDLYDRWAKEPTRPMTEQDLLEMQKAFEMAAKEEPFEMPNPHSWRDTEWGIIFSFYIVILSDLSRKFWFVPAGIAMILYGLSGSISLGLALPIACLVVGALRLIFWRPIQRKMARLQNILAHIIEENCTGTFPPDPRPAMAGGRSAEVAAMTGTPEDQEDGSAPPPGAVGERNTEREASR